MTTAPEVHYGPAHTFEPLFRAVLRDPACRAEITLRLAVLEQNEEISREAVDFLLPRIAPHLPEDRRNLWFHELKSWLLMQERAEIDDGRPAGTPRSVWEDRCQAGVDEAMHELTGVK